MEWVELVAVQKSSGLDRGTQKDWNETYIQEVIALIFSIPLPPIAVYLDLSCSSRLRSRQSPS